MSWIKMSFKGQQVFVHADDAGRPILDPEGRAEMKYRESDSRSYRPALVNLGKAAAGAVSARPSNGGAAPKRKPAAKRPPPGPASTATQHVWTDGACTGNPGPMGIGVLVLWDEKRRELSEFLGVGTNNIAELTAIERGLDIAEEAAPARDRPVRVYTDSAYSIGVLSMGWKAKANQELVGRIRERLKDFVDVTFIKVAGHAGVPENERCDELARQAITNRGRA
ncbi:MAG TPA: ribonuclease H [Polyangia bacterium]